jgi:hypothetical protein
LSRPTIPGSQLPGVGIASGATTYTATPRKEDPDNKLRKKIHGEGRKSRSVEFCNSIESEADLVQSLPTFDFEGFIL